MPARRSRAVPLATLFDDVAPPASKWEIQVRRRGPASRPDTPFAAIVLGEHAHYVVGLFPTREDARAAARAWVATDPEEPDPETHCSEWPAGWHRRRTDGRRTDYRWTREVKGRAVQARFWLGVAGGSLNLGLYTRDTHGEQAAWAAWQVSKAFAREWKPGVTVAEAVAALRRSPRLAERPRADFVIPEWQAVLKPATDYGVMLTAAERRERERAGRATVTLADYAAPSGVPVGTAVPAKGLLL
jgi:hypothetical protein